MAAQTSDLNTVQLRLRNAIYLYPMQRRVSELLNILAECSMKDLQIFFPFLVEHIFGVNPSYGNGWNLLRISRKNNGDFEALFRFLHPFGPFFELVYKLLGDVYLKYDYPLTFLSSRLRQVILDGTVPPFYVDKLQIDPKLREPTGLILNAFEFYLFHFAYHLINSWQSKIDPGYFGGHETVYLHLSDQYLQHFLPIETSVVLPVVPIHQTVHSPRSPPPQVQPQTTPKLFKNSVVKIGSNRLSPTTVSQPHAEIWRSETFVQTIINFWLSVPDQSVLSNLFVNMKSQDMRTSEDTLPKEDHLRVVRNMIKHIHYFVNNIHNDGSAMDELRKVITSLCRRPLYIFLRRHIYHWPLDSSFLLILETYLSFIQPWRYIKYNTSESHFVDNKWFNFIVENFPAYTILIREIIPRFSRMDLTSPKHAHMLFRLSKVLSQPNLAATLKDIEGHLDDANNSAHETSHLPSTPLGTPKSPCSSSTPNTPNSPSHSNALSFPWFNRLNVVIRQEIQEVESPNFQYKTLFGQEFHNQVFEFVLSIQQSLSLVKYLLNSELAQRQKRRANFFQRVKDFFLYSPSGDDYTVDERQKTVSYLEHSITFLSQVFELPPLQLPPENRTKSDISNSSMNSSCPQQVGSVEPKVINPKDWQRRTKLIRYEANPDLEPIRSTEITFLVRFFHHLSTRINEKYRDELIDFWERSDFWGNVARQLLAPPCKFYYFDKSVPGNFAPRVQDQLPPRVSLRTLASHQTLSYIFLSALFERFMSRRREGSSRPQEEVERFVPLDVSFVD